MIAHATKKWMTALTCCLLFSSGLTQGANSQGLPPIKGIMKPAVTISGPYKKGNMSIFLLHGKDSIKGKNFLTLKEGLMQKKLIVYETGDVNELSVENRSDQLVFIQSGEIVKGGRQDRTFQFDMILPPHSGKVPIKAFCVEHGRWSQRGAEPAGNFTASPAALPTPALKKAAHEYGDQLQVWNKVAEAQSKLVASLPPPPLPAASAGAVITNIYAPVSPTSLQLSLENKDLQKQARERTAGLENIVNNQSDVIGYACAINGKITSADIYASNSLFKKLWPKLLQCSAIESLSDAKEKQSVKPADTKAVNDFLSQPAPGAPKARPINSRVSEMKVESSANVVFQTIDRVFVKCCV